jgi:hypothetical protein
MDNIELGKLLSEEERSANLTMFGEDTKKVIALIKSMDKSKYSEYDDEVEVVGVDVLDLPILAALSDMFYKGMGC